MTSGPPQSSDRSWVVPVERAVTATARLLDSCLSPLHREPADPTLRRTSSGWWRTARTPCGPGLQQLVRSGDDVVVTCWGPGAAWLAEQAPRLLGAVGEPLDDDAVTELLEPFRGHRYRVEVLLAGLPGPERHGPRRPLPTHLPH